MHKIPLINLPLQYQKLKKEIDPVIKRILKDGNFILGNDLRLFEQQFAKYQGTKYCLGVSTGSMALILALKAIGIQRDDEILCPILTFTSTAEAIVHVGATPVFIDIDKDTYNIDKNQIIQKITKKTKAIIVVHLYGQITNMDEISKIAKKYKLRIIEDAAQAHGATYKGKRAGSWGDVACFSFYPSKNLGCFGDGGCVVTNNKKIADQIKLLRFHGSTSKYHHKIVGNNALLDNLQAAILLVKLKYLNEWNERKRQIAKYYSENLSEIYTYPFNHPESNHIYYVYTLQHKKRNQIIDLLKKKGVDSGIYYPVPLHLQPAYSNLKYRRGNFPIAENACKNIFSIPIYPELTQKEIVYIATALNSIAEGIKNG